MPGNPLQAAFWRHIASKSPPEDPEAYLFELLGEHKCNLNKLSAALAGTIPGAPPTFPSRPFVNIQLRHEDRRARYVAMREACAGAYVEAADAEVENVPAERDAVARAKLRTEHWRWKAGVMNREEYGETPSGPAVEINLGALHLQALTRPAKRLPAETEPSDAEG